MRHAAGSGPVGLWSGCWFGSDKHLVSKVLTGDCSTGTAKTWLEVRESRSLIGIGWMAVKLKQDFFLRTTRNIEKCSETDDLSWMKNNNADAGSQCMGDVVVVGWTKRCCPDDVNFNGQICSMDRL